MLLKSEISKVEPKLHDVKSEVYSIEKGLKTSQRQFESFEINQLTLTQLLKNFSKILQEQKMN